MPAAPYLLRAHEAGVTRGDAILDTAWYRIVFQVAYTYLFTFTHNHGHALKPVTFRSDKCSFDYLLV